MEDEQGLGDEQRPETEQESSPKKPKARGTTTGLKDKNKKGPRHIEFDENDVPFGVWKKSFATEMGVQARNIKITHQTWKKVPKGKKETIWRHVKTKYNIEDESKEKVVLKIVAKRYKDFKSRLRGIYVYKTRKPSNKKEKMNTNPCEAYTQITKEVWAEFEIHCNDLKYKEKSDKGREAQKKNVHPHYMGRAGYVGKANEWFEEEITKEKASNPDADPIVVEDIVTNRLKDRSYKWIKAHTPPTSDPPPHTQEVINSINHWSNLEKTGEFVPFRMEDVLVKATGKKEHTGRTRGVGGDVGNQKYFGKPTREKIYTAKEFDAFKEEVRKSNRAEMMSIMAEMARTNGWKLPDNFDFGERVSHSSPLGQEHNSCHSVDPKDPFHDLKDSVPCRLAVLDDNNLVIVAEGIVLPWKENDYVHSIQLSKNNVHVTIDRVLNSTAILPVPWQGFTTVGDAEGSFAQWPKKWVSLIQHEESIDKLKKRNNLKDTRESRNKAKRNDDDIGTRNIEEVKKSRKTNKTVENVVKHGNSTKKKAIDKQVQNKSDQLPPLTQNELDTLGPYCKRLASVVVSLGPWSSCSSQASS